LPLHVWPNLYYRGDWNWKPTALPSPYTALQVLRVDEHDMLAMVSDRRDPICYILNGARQSLVQFNTGRIRPSWCHIIGSSSSLQVLSMVVPVPSADRERELYECFDIVPAGHYTYSYFDPEDVQGLSGWFISVVASLTSVVIVFSPFAGYVLASLAATASVTQLSMKWSPWMIEEMPEDLQQVGHFEYLLKPTTLIVNNCTSDHIPQVLDSFLTLSYLTDYLCVVGSQNKWTWIILGSL
jgi:hypothetical protein